MTTSDLWDADTAARYDDESAQMFAADVLDPAVTFLARLADKGRVHCARRGDGRAVGDDEGALLQVRYTGIGMSGEQQSRLFTTFSQADASTTGAYPRGGGGDRARAVRAMGGSVEVESAAGVGTTFRVRLPLPAHEPTEAVSLPSPRAPEAPWPDVQMPELDGYQATRELRAAGMVLPVVAMSAGDLDEDRQACFAAGMDDFLPKPWTAQQLATVLHLHLGAEAGAF